VSGTILLLFAALALGAPAPAPFPGPLQTPLGQAAESFARSWGAGDAGAIGELIAPEGVRLHLERAGRAPLPARQAVAALRDYFGGHRPGEARVGRLSEVGGDPARGFAEVIWLATPAGTSEASAVSLYVGFVQLPEGGAWRVDEIRILRSGN
jgi:hypothetical protein